MRDALKTATSLFCWTLLVGVTLPILLPYWFWRARQYPRQELVVDEELFWDDPGTALERESDE